MNGSLHTIGGRNVLRFERRLAHPVEKVWRAVTDPAEMAHWFPAIVEMDFRVGGRITFAFPGGAMDPSEGSITELDPPRVFAFSWNGDPLRLELRPDGAGSVLIFTHTFDDRPMAGSFATGWETCLGALDKILSGPPTEGMIKPERYAERHDGYVAAFGLGEGTVAEDERGCTVRFERLLPHPVEEVWPALAGPEESSAGGPPPVGATNGYVTAGALTAAEPGTVLEYEWLAGGEPAGRVRWELTGGHPAGTRVVLTQSGPPRLGGEHVTALAAWHTHLEVLADHLRGVEHVTALAAWHTHLEVLADHLRGVEHCPWPKERTEELREHYAAT